MDIKIYPNSIELKKLKKEIYQLHYQNKYPESIPLLEKYLSINSDHIIIHLLYAKSLVLDSSLKSPLKKDTPDIREKKHSKLDYQYKKASSIFSEYIPVLEKLYLSSEHPGIEKYKKEISIWYFYYSVSEILQKNYISAIVKLEKCIRLNPNFKEAYYNLGSLYDKTGDQMNAEKNWKRYKEL